MTEKKKKKDENGLVGMFDEDASEATESSVPSDSSLAQVSDLARRQVDLEDEIVQIEESLKEKKRELAKVSEVDIPEAFAELGIAELSLDTGEKVKVERKIKAGITKKNEEKAFSWLRDNGADALIKAEVKTKFGRGKRERELQEKAITKLKDSQQILELWDSW